MSEPKGPIAAENLSTVAAVGAVLGVLALAYGIYLHRQIQYVAVGSGALEVKAARRDVELNKELDELKARIAALEAEKASNVPPGAATTIAASAAPAAPVEAGK